MTQTGLPTCERFEVIDPRADILFVGSNEEVEDWIVRNAKKIVCRYQDAIMVEFDNPVVFDPNPIGH